MADRSTGGPVWADTFDRPLVESYSKSAVRALDLLGYFHEVQRPLRACEVASRFGWKASSTAQLLKSLLDAAYLLFDDRDKIYQPAPKLLNSASSRLCGAFGFDKVRRLLDIAFAEMGRTQVVSLTARYGGAMQIIDVLEPQPGPGSQLAGITGLTVPITDSLAGPTLLSAMPPVEMRRVVRQYHLGSRFGAQFVNDFLRVVEDIRADGFGYGYMAGRRHDVAVVIPRAIANVPLVIGVNGPAHLTKGDAAEFAALINDRIRAIQAGRAGERRIA